MNYKLLALDIDGTIVKEGSDEVSEKIKTAIQKASKKLQVSLVSARSKHDQEIMIKLLNLPPAYHVIENGAKVMDPNGDIMFNIHIPQVEVQELLDITNPYFAEVGFCIDNHWINDDVDTSEGLVTGISFTCHEYEQGHLLREAILNLPNEYFVYVGRHWLNYNWCGVLVFHKDANKGNGLKFIQDKLNIKPEETIAVGDTGFDMPMFEHAGLKVAMENGEDVIKEVADVIAKPVDEHGLAAIIDTYILEKKD
jgi:HAD superfamily hydrolase (TIGR01484 family)